MRRLHIDIETYSSADLLKEGLYRYVEAPDFEILLLAYAFDDGIVEIIDLANGERLPLSLMHALSDPDIEKHAFNAAFELHCLRQIWPDIDIAQWRCTMIHSLYCGHPGSLENAGKALGLGQDKQKLATGRALIRTFCSPVKPSRANGGRTRNRPHHEPEKWQLFREYCRQDVEAEREVHHRLSRYPVPDGIWSEWRADRVINERGIAVDLDLVDAAMDMHAETRARLLEEAVALTGLDNPGSVQQLRAWLEEETGEELPNLRKETVSTLLDGADNDRARRVLEIRQALGKASIAKYQAMRNTACADGRIRGQLQFYGAERTGRWAGRQIQPQNLPRIYIEELRAAREIAKARNAAGLELCFGNVTGTLSQLVRTALIASPGHLLISADFSAIEARVIAWLAKEQWRLDVFATHGKIYEASAAQMFGVPLERIVRGNPEYALRQKGKVAELALGYQGSTGALINQGALKMGLDEAELPQIVRQWREANTKITQLWDDLNEAGLRVVNGEGPQRVQCIELAREGDMLVMRLPSGRKLHYAQPFPTLNRWEKPSIGYYGMQKTWCKQELYGGKLTENAVQAIARDCLALAMARVTASGFNIVFHVHDEIVIEAPEENAEADLAKICAIMAQPVPWAPGLQLKADGYASPFYKKD